MTSTMWNGVGGWVDLLRVPPSGTWERRSRRPVRRGRGLDDGTARATRRTRGSSSWSAATSAGSVPRRAKDIASWAGHLARHARAGARADAVAAVPRRGRRRAARSPEGAAPGRRRPGTRPVPARRGTPRCSSTRDGRRSCPSGSDRCCSTRRPRTRSRASWWTGRSRARGGTTAARVVVSPFEPLPRAARRERRRRGAAARGVARVTVRSRGGRRSARRPPAA